MEVVGHSVEQVSRPLRTLQPKADDKALAAMWLAYTRCLPLTAGIAMMHKGFFARLMQ